MAAPYPAPNESAADAKGVNGTDVEPVFKLGIVGGGIVGLTAAIALARKRPDADITIFESARAFAEIGAGMGFSANAVRALDYIGVGDPFRQVAEIGFKTYDEQYRFTFPEYRDAYTGKHIYTADARGMCTIHRAKLMDVLVDQLPRHVKIAFGRRAVGFKQTDDKVTVLFDNIGPDGTKSGSSEYVVDALIGADGVKSAIREACYPNQINEGFEYSGTYAYRALIPAKPQIEKNGPHVATVPQVYVGKGKHILCYLIDGGETMNVVACISDRSNPRGERKWTRPWVEQVPKEEAVNDFADMCPAARNIIADIVTPTRYAIHEVKPLPSWSHNRVMLIGDAAHAMVPHAGAGAGQGVEDAVVLAELLAHPECTAANLPEFLKVAEAQRRPRALRVQSISHEFGELFQREHPDPTGKDPWSITQQCAQRWEYIIKHDIDHDIEDALGKLRNQGVIAPVKTPSAAPVVAAEEKKIKIVAISGALRKASLNTKLVHAAAKLVPEGVQYEVLDWSAVPVFNQDLETAELMPKAVVDVRQRVLDADAVFIASPEYNYSIPGPLKNLLDWLSRPYNAKGDLTWSAGAILPLREKPVFLAGLSPFNGGAATARGQMALRQALVYPNCYVLNEPFIAMPGGSTVFKEDDKGHPLLEFKDGTNQRNQVTEAMKQLVDAARTRAKTRQFTVG